MSFTNTNYKKSLPGKQPLCLRLGDTIHLADIMFRAEYHLPLPTATLSLFPVLVSLYKLRNFWCQLLEIPRQSLLSLRVQIKLFSGSVKVKKKHTQDWLQWRACQRNFEIFPWQKKRGNETRFTVRVEKRWNSLSSFLASRPIQFCLLGQNSESSSEHNISTPFNRDEIPFLS